RAAACSTGEIWPPCSPNCCAITRSTSLYRIFTPLTVAATSSPPPAPAVLFPSPPDAPRNERERTLGGNQIFRTVFLLLVKSLRVFTNRTYRTHRTYRTYVSYKSYS